MRAAIKMFLKKSISNGKVYLSFVQGYREDGKSKQKTIQKIGYLEDLEKIYDDPISHFKAIAEEHNSNLKATSSIEVLTNQRLEDNCSLRKNLGYAILNEYMRCWTLLLFFKTNSDR